MLLTLGGHHAGRRFPGRVQSALAAAGTLLASLLAPLLLNLSAAAQEPITLRYFTWDAGPAIQSIYEDFIEPFEALHPHIKIEHEATDFGTYWNKLLTYYAAGLSPDLMHMSVGYVYEYAEEGLLLNLQPLFDRDLNPADFFLEPMKAVRYPSMETGDLYAMPFSFVMSTTYYNKTLFDQTGVAYPSSGWTYDDLREIGRRLVRDENGDGMPERWGFHSNYDYQLLEPVIHAFGGRVLDDEFNVAVTQPGAVAGVQYLVDLIHRDQVAPPLDLLGDRNAAFRNAQVAMIIANSFDLGTYRELADFDWDVVTLPEGPARRVNRVWPDSFAISSKVPQEHQEAAWEFIKFVVTSTKVDAYYHGARRIPIYRPLAESLEWLEAGRTPNKQVFIESIATGEPLEFRPNWGDWHNARAATLRPAWLGQIPVEQALLDWAQAIANAIRD